MGRKSTFWLTETGRMLYARKYKAAMVLLVFVAVLAYPARADTNIDNCTTLNVDNETYVLTDNINNTEEIVNCIVFNGVNIVLDCQGNDIGALMPASSNSGIYISSSINSTIKNCIISNWKNGVLGSTDSDLIKIINSTFFNNTEGLSGSGFIAYINNSTFYDSGFDHIFVFDANNWTIINSKFYGTGDIYFDSNVDDGNFYNNLFNTSVYPVAASVNNWNTTQQSGTRIYSAGTEIGGNYWTNSTANGYSDTCTDLLQDGFCDDPYDVEAGVACAAVADGLPACGNNTDWLPLSAFYEEPQCVQEWNCTAWGECIRGQQTRECTDLNECQNETGRPAQSQACLKGLPNATYNISSDCCPISTFYCTDNETLVQLWNTSQGVSWAVEDCEFGCDNTTETCMPPSGQQNLLLFGVIVAFCVLGALFWRWSRR